MGCLYLPRLDANRTSKEDRPLQQLASSAMSRGGAGRPVTLKPNNTQWFNPDELDESAYGPAPGGSTGPALGSPMGRTAPSPGRGGLLSPMIAAGGRGGPARGGPLGARGGSLAAGRGGGGMGAPGSLGHQGTSRFESLAANEAAFGSVDSPSPRTGIHPPGTPVVGRPPSFGSRMPLGKLNASVEILELREHEDLEGDRVSGDGSGGASGGGGGGGGGKLRRLSSGQLAPLGALKGPPPPAEVPDRPGTLTTTTTQTDQEGRTIVTKTTVTRTHSGRIRTEVATTTSCPAHLINGQARGSGGAAASELYDDPALSPGVRLPQGPGHRAARASPGGGSPLESPTAGMPLSPVGGAGRMPGGGGSILGGGAGAGPGGVLMSPRRPLGIGDSGGPGSGGGGPVVMRRPSITGIVPSQAAATPGNRTTPSVMTAPSAPTALHAAGPANLRSTWGGAGGGVASGPHGGGGGAGALNAMPMRLSSPARVPHGALAPPLRQAGGGGVPAVGPHANASPSRLQSAGRMRMSPGFAAAHGLGGNGSAGDVGQPDALMFGSGGGGGGGGAGDGPGLQRPMSGRHGSTSGMMPVSSSQDRPDSAARLRQMVLEASGGGGGGMLLRPGSARTPRATEHGEGDEEPTGEEMALKSKMVRAAAATPPAVAAAAAGKAAPPVRAAAAQSPRRPPPQAATGKMMPSPSPPQPPSPPTPPTPSSPSAPSVPRSPQPPPSPPPGDGPEEGVRGRAKVLAAAKVMGTRRNAGRCAVSLAFLRRFRSLLLRERPDASKLSTSQVVMEVIKPMTAAVACRLTDLPELCGEDDVGTPEYFISHAWSMRFLQLLDYVFNHLQGALESTRVWLDIFAVNQHPGAEQKDDLENLRTAIALSSCTLVCLDAAGTPMERVWCLYEFDNTLTIKGADALVLLTPGFSIREIASIFRSIDVDAAKATVASDKNMILDDIRKKHGSTQAFNTKLKLRFLLDPLDCKPDMVALAARAGPDPGQWDLSPLAGWVADPAGPQLAVLAAPPGTGKSTITAVLCMGPEAAAAVAAAAASGAAPDRPPTAAPAGRRSTPGMVARRISTPGVIAGQAPQPPPQQPPPQPPSGGGASGPVVHAYHFCKYSDARRQDPVRVVKSLAYQLAHSLPALAAHYCSLDPGTLMQLHQPDAACRELLVAPLQQHCRGQQILLVLDALDEAEKPPTHGSPSSASSSSALDNKVLQLLLHQLAGLPPCVRLFTTVRPDPQLLGPLRARFPNLLELGPGQLRRQDKTNAAMQTRLVERFGEATARQLLAAGGGTTTPASPSPSDPACDPSASMVYYPVVALLRAPLEAVPRDLPEAYGAVFVQQWLEDEHVAQKVQQLLAVLVAAQEPPPMSLLAGLELSEALNVLPGWGVLFYDRDHAVHVLHRTLIDWLEDPSASGRFHADGRLGHALLGRHLLRSRPLGVYGARYLVTHLIGAGSEPGALDAALQDLSYLEAACRTGDVFKLHAELASLPPSRTTPVVADVVRWLGLQGAVLRAHPQAVTQIAAEAPRCSCMWQVGSRFAAKTPVDMVNEPATWPLEVMALTAHKAPVHDVSYSPDGALLVSASLDGSVRLYDAGTGEPKAVLAAPPTACLSYSPDGMMLAAGGDGGGVALWDPRTGVPLGSLDAHSGAGVSVLAFSGDGKVLASGGRDKTVRLWHSAAPLPPSKACNPLKGHSGPLTTLAFSADGATMASAAAGDPVPRLWNVAEGKLQAALEGHRQGVLALAFSPTSPLLATAADNVRLWDAATGAPLGALTDHLFPVAAVAFTPNGSLLVSTDTSHTLRLWAMGGTGPGGGGPRQRRGGRPGGGPPGGGPPAGVLPMGVLEAESVGQLSALAVSPDGALLASASTAGELHVFAVAAASNGDGSGGGGVFTVRAAHAGPVHRLSFSPDSSSLVSASEDCTLRLWDPRTALLGSRRAAGGEGDMEGLLEALAMREHGSGQSQASTVIFSVHFSRGSALVPLVAAAVEEDGGLTLWDGATGELLPLPQAAQQGGRGGGGGGGAAGGRPTVVRMSADEETLAVGDVDGIIKLWDLVKGGLRARLKGHGDAITDLAFCPAASAALASVSADCRGRLWNATNGRQLAILSGHTAAATSVSYSDDGALVAGGCEEGPIRVWAAGTDTGGRAAAVLQGHSGPVTRLAFCPGDSNLLASGGEDRSVRLWDVGRGSQLALLGEHKESVGRLVWGGGGRLLASGSRGEGSAGSVFVWDCRTGESVYAVHAAYMAGEDSGRPWGAADGGSGGGGGGLCTIVSALEHAPHVTLVRESDGQKRGSGSGGVGGAGGSSRGEKEVEAGGGLLLVRQVPVYTSFAAPACVAVAGEAFAMAFGSRLNFYRVNNKRAPTGDG